MTRPSPLPDADNPDTLIQLFDALFLPTMKTRLVPGNDEPLYLPADVHHPHHRILFARGFFSSALHEISHWCIAGYERRQLEDFGYWYLPDGRDQHRQQAFERVEVRPQAVEQCLALACGRVFHISVDNLDSDVEVDREAFAHRVNEQADHYRQHGLPPRAEVLFHAMKDFYINGFSINEVAGKQLPFIKKLR